MLATRHRLSKSSNGHRLKPHQKACPKCHRIVHIDLARCPSCEHAPWSWNPNRNFLLITVIIALFLFVLVPMMTRQTAYHRPETIVSGE